MPKYDRSLRYLLEPSLWQRNLQEFKYTVNLFEIFLDSGKLRSYFKDIDGIEEKDLYLDGKIKPVGSKSNPTDLDTLYGTVKSWEDGGNEADPSEGDSKKSNKDSKKPQVSMTAKNQAKKKPYTNFDDALNSKPKEGDLLYIQTPVQGNVSPEEYINAYEPGFYKFIKGKLVRVDD